MTANHVLLETIEVTQSVASVIFDNIPQTGYTDLKIVGSPRVVSGGGQGNNVLIRFNGDSGNNYSYKALEGFSGTFVQSYGATSQSRGLFAGATTDATEANTFGTIEIYIPNYTSSLPKVFGGEGWCEFNSTTQGPGGLYVNSYSQTSAISSITVFSNANWAPFTTFSLYGVAALGTEPTIAPLATGGNIIAQDGTYWYHAFTSSGTFTPLKALSCDYLVIGGGGGGVGDFNSGGGAGGYRTSIGGTPLSLTAQNYAVTVGAGGSGTSDALRSGSSSVFSTITSAGGGGGNAVAGGSGSGAFGGFGPEVYAGGLGNTPSTSPSQGNNGGTGTGQTASWKVSGGGGGAGAVGANGTNSPRAGGAGGSGSNSASAWASVTNTGVSGFYAGGGGAGGSTSYGVSAGAGGSGGGGAGSSNGTGANGIANTGGGGGGSAEPGSGGPASNVGGAGGSGIVIIRYEMA